MSPQLNNGTPSTARSSPRGLPEFDISGKIIIVSGGAQGLGIAQAEALLEAGAIGE